MKTFTTVKAKHGNINHGHHDTGEPGALNGACPVRRGAVTAMRPPLSDEHGRLKFRLRPMRGLKKLRCAEVISAGHAFIQNVRREHYELGVENSKPTGPGCLRRTGLGDLTNRNQRPCLPRPRTTQQPRSFRSDASASASANTATATVPTHSKHDHTPQITNPARRVTPRAAPPTVARDHKISDYLRETTPRPNEPKGFLKWTRATGTSPAAYPVLWEPEGEVSPATDRRFC